MCLYVYCMCVRGYTHSVHTFVASVCGGVSVSSQKVFSLGHTSQVSPNPKAHPTHLPSPLPPGLMAFLPCRRGPPGTGPSICDLRLQMALWGWLPALLFPSSSGTSQLLPATHKASWAPFQPVGPAPSLVPAALALTPSQEWVSSCAPCRG